MLPQEKTKLISEIHQIFTENAVSIEGIAADCLVYLYPAIVNDKKCQLWGSSESDVIFYIFLKTYFDENHKIWDYIECLEEDDFVLEAVYHVEKKMSWQFTLKSKCLYNVYYNTCFNFETDIYNSKGELIREYLNVDIPDNNLIPEEYAYMVSNPMKICDICYKSYEECECSADDN